MKEVDFIHLATHGKADAVYFAGRSEQEATLTMGDVEKLSLQARLVVLSECDSFRGEYRSDGVIGVARAFLAAGALTVVASLWKVHDDATRQLMKQAGRRQTEN